jgi:hypothetical protein
MPLPAATAILAIVGKRGRDLPENGVKRCDVRYGSVKRVASAVGAGAIAIQSVHEYLSSALHHDAGTVEGPLHGWGVAASRPVRA